MTAAFSIDTARVRALICLLSFVTCACAQGQARQVDGYHWQGVERTVAIGDLHGDYDQYIKVMQDAGLVNQRGRWSGGDTHLVQTGDIPDRGPDTLRIIEHLKGLKEQAEKNGGRVHTLIGNHEAMNTYGDLRYVHPGEFAAFQTRNSAAYREKQWEFTLQQMQQNKPEEFALLDQARFRAEWEQKIPLGWVEHRFAWSPQGEYGQWVLSNPVAVMVNDTIFLHGGISPTFCKLSLAEISEQAHAQIRAYDPAKPGVIDAEDGPLWYRGLATEDEAAFSDTLDLILQRYGAKRIVVGHTPTGGVVWPRFGQRVVVNDTGIARYYGANDGFLELTPDAAVAGYGDRRLPLPDNDGDRIAYLEQVVVFKPDNEALAQRLERLKNPPPVATPELDPDADVAVPAPVVIEAVSPGTCQ